MKRRLLRVLARSSSSLAAAVIKPAHFSGVGLCLCLVLALATPPSSTQRANASRVAFPKADDGRAAGALVALDARTMQGIGNSQRLVSYFEDMGYRLDWLRGGMGTVPRLYLANLPRDLPRLESPEIRKAVFIKAMLPMILRVNEEILGRRARLERLAEKIKRVRTLSEEEEAWLASTAKLYDLKKPDLPELLRRIDVVPPSLALAQAALESGWGTSRFAQNGNALFGQKIFINSPNAMPSFDGAGNEVFRMRTFDDLLASVRSYAHNLNSHPAYTELRRLRAEMRRRAPYDKNIFVSIDSERLIGGLLSYSERGGDYVADLRHLLRANGLRGFDRARLANDQVAGRFRTGA